MNLKMYSIPHEIFKCFYCQLEVTLFYADNFGLHCEKRFNHRITLSHKHYVININTISNSWHVCSFNILLVGCYL